MKLGKKLSQEHFIISHVLILLAGLAFLGCLYYILNIQYQPPKQTFQKGPVTSVPKSLRLNLDQPDEDSLFFTPSIIVSGKTSPEQEVLISTQSDDVVIKSKADGSFSATLDLDAGVNAITVVTFDATGDSRSQERTVYFSKEKI